MREPTDFEESGPGLRTFTLNSDYAHWLTLEEQEESMLPKVARPESLNGRVDKLPSGVEEGDCNPAKPAEGKRRPSPRT